MKLIHVVFLAVLSHAAVIDVREEDEPVDGKELEHIEHDKVDPVESGSKARNKIEAMDRTLNKLIAALEVEMKLYEKSLERRLNDVSIGTPPRRSCDAKNRSKRFLNPFQIFHSVFDEGLDHPNIPYVNSPAPALSLYNVFGDGEDEEDEIGRYSYEANHRKI
jgi:hypothetical protein